MCRQGENLRGKFEGVRREHLIAAGTKDPHWTAPDTSESEVGTGHADNQLGAMVKGQNQGLKVRKPGQIALIGMIPLMLRYYLPRLNEGKGTQKKPDFPMPF